MLPVQAEPSLFDVIHAMWRGRAAVALGGVAGLVLAVVFLVLAVPQYRIAMLVAPAERAPKADLKALLPDNPGFALQYLVNTIGSQDATDFMRFETMLRGPQVAGMLLADAKIKTGMEQSRKFAFLPPLNLDGAASLSTVLEKQLRIAPVGNTPLRRISIDHHDPVFGLYLLNKLYAETDRVISGEVAEKARTRSLYLKDALGRVNHPDHRRALTSLLMEQEHILMLLAMEEPFAAIITEPAYVSARIWWPRKSLVLPGFILAGMVCGFALWSFRQK